MDQPNKASGKEQNVTMGILSYLGPLVIISFVSAKDDPFVKFHIKQGAVLFAINIVVWIVSSMMWQLGTLLNLVNLGILVLAVIGIVNVVKGKEKKLPVIGDLAKYIKL